MGLFDGIFGGSSKTTTKTSYDKETQAAQQALMKGVLTGMDPYLSNPSAYVAPMNDYQAAMGAGTKSFYDQMSGSNQAGKLGDYASQYQGLGDTSAMMARMGGMDQYIPGYSQQAIDASTIGMNDIMALANPYADQMMDAQQRRLDDNYATTQNDIGARAAAGGAFGGSREAVQRGMGADSYMQNSQDMAAQVMYDAYGQGASLAGQNAAARTAALQNAGNDVYNRAMGAATYDDNLGNDAFSRQLQALSGASGYDLSKAGFNNTAMNDYAQRNTSALGLMGGYGDVLRSYQQEQGDAPYTQFQRLAPFVPSYQPTQTTKSPTPGLLQTAVGAGLAIGSSGTAGGGSLFGKWFS